MLERSWLLYAGLCWPLWATPVSASAQDTSVEVTQAQPPQPAAAAAATPAGPDKSAVAPVNPSVMPTKPGATPDKPAALEDKSATAPAAKDAAKNAPTAPAADDASKSPEAATGASAPPAAAPTPAQPFNVRLRALEERVNELKEKIFQSKARLIQLQEVVLHGTISGAKAVIVHKNEMGSSFRLIRVQYALDGAPIFNRVDSGQGELDAQHEIEIFNGSIAPGNHIISTYLEYQGYGYGVFSYLKGYQFKIKSSYTLNAEEGKLTTVRIVGFEKGGLTTQLKDRPNVRYDVETTQAPKPTQEAASPAHAPPGAEAAPGK